MVENINNNNRITPQNAEDLRSVQLRALVTGADEINVSQRPRINGREIDEALHAFEERYDLDKEHDVTRGKPNPKVASAAQHVFRSMRKF